MDDGRRLPQPRAPLACPRCGGTTEHACYTEMGSLAFFNPVVSRQFQDAQTLTACLRMWARTRPTPSWWPK